jgi:GNAT superfamily N-acetyltransferase
LPEFQKQGVGKLLLDYVKKRYAKHKIIAETDEESVGFYLKSDFLCNAFKSNYKNLRYNCEYVALDP